MKAYVAVELLTDAAGRMHPKAVILEDGRRYEIARVSDMRRAASLKAGGTGLRYLVTIGSRDTYLFFEDPRWFVELQERGR